MSATALFAGTPSPRAEDYIAVGVTVLFVAAVAAAGLLVVWFGHRTAPRDRGTE